MSRRIRSSILAVVLLMVGTLVGTAGQSAAAASHRSATLAVGSQFADPAIFYDGASQRWYLYRTGGKSFIGVTSSASPHGPYGVVTPTMTTAAPWVNASDPRYWAPDVFYVDTASGLLYVMYYSAIYRTTGLHCIGVATSPYPDHGFVDNASTPFQCSIQGAGHEAIDPSLFVAGGGKRYLLYKDNYANVSDFEIVRVPVDDETGTVHRPGGVTKPILTPTDPTENPSAVAHGGRVWLFVSKNRWDVGCEYLTSVYSADTIDGPYRFEKEVLNRDITGGLCGPGGANVLQKDGATYIAFHAWKDPQHAKGDGVRQAWVGDLAWSSANGRPYLA